MANKTYFIIPLNEGQELNYNESFNGGITKAIERAKYLQINLQKILTAGSISIRVEGDEVDWVVDNNCKVESYS